MKLIKTLKEVYVRPLAVLQSGIFFVVFALLIAVFQNLGQIGILFGYKFSILKKFELLFSVVTNFYTQNLSGTALYLHLILLLLLSVNFTLMFYYFKKRGSVVSTKGSALGSALALIGSGCAACGGVLASTGIGTASGLSGTLLMPFTGDWFLYLAIGILLYSIYSISKKIQTPFVC